MERPPLIRTIYLYLFALLGLVLMTIGGVRFVDMTLKALVFTRADEEQKFWQGQPPAPPAVARTLPSGQPDPQEQAALDQWRKDYDGWRESARHIDPVVSRRQRDASSSIAMIGIGLPLYLFHWKLIRRQTGSS